MKRSFSLFLALVASVVISGTVRAADEQMKMAPPKPAPELAALNSFNGHWGCTGHVLPNDMMVPPHKTLATVSSNLDLNGFWRMFRYSEMKTKENPMPYAVMGAWGYDASQKKYVQMSADNMGASLTAWSSGWNGDEITFEGESMVMGQKMMMRDNFTKKGMDAFMHTAEFQGKDGTWAKFDEETCKKVVSKAPAKSGAPSK